MAEARLWMVGDTEEIRRTVDEAARWVGVRLEMMDWDQADLALRSVGCPDGVILTDWDLKLDPDDCRAYLARCPRVLLCQSLPFEELDPLVLERPSVELLPMPFDLDDFGAALAWLGGAPIEPAWAGSKNSLHMVLADA
jgi:hypothetical protein